MKLSKLDLEHIADATRNWGGRILLDLQSKDLLAQYPAFLTVDVNLDILRASDLLFTSQNLKNWQALPSAICGVGIDVGDYHCELQDLKVLKNEIPSGTLPKWEPSDLKPCLFLDRDNVVVPDVPYNGNPEKVSLKDGIVTLMQEAHDKGWWIVLVTNQSGLGRGRITWSQYRDVHQRLQQLLAQQGQWFDDAQWAGFHETAGNIRGKLFPQMRKPRPGMFFEAHWKLGIEFSKSVIVGDSATDLIAGFRAGVRRLILLDSDKTQKELELLREFNKANAEFKFENSANLGIHL